MPGNAVSIGGTRSKRRTAAVPEWHVRGSSDKSADFQFLLIDLDHDKIDATPDVAISASESSVKTDDIRYVIYTSGSTGRPKGVAIEHRNAVCFAASRPHAYWLTEMTASTLL